MSKKQEVGSGSAGEGYLQVEALELAELGERGGEGGQPVVVGLELGEGRAAAEAVGQRLEQVAVPASEWQVRSSKQEQVRSGKQEVAGQKLVASEEAASRKRGSK